MKCKYKNKTSNTYYSSLKFLILTSFSSIRSRLTSSTTTYTWFCITKAVCCDSSLRTRVAASVNRLKSLFRLLGIYEDKLIKSNNVFNKSTRNLCIHPSQRVSGLFTSSKKTLNLTLQLIDFTYRISEHLWKEPFSASWLQQK